MREISVEECVNLLKRQPIFSSWSEDLLNQFIHELEISFFRAGEVIVTEGEIVTKFYFIVKGNAEVSKHEARDPTKQYVVATLHAGESIGLTDSGLYSTTGIRTATVLAITNISLITIDVELFHRFLVLHPALNASLESATQQILKLYLIKQATPFTELSINEIKSLAEKIDVIDLPENTMVFNQGDKGDYCYLIQEGHVEIIRQEQNELPEILAVLSAKAVFGEIAILMDLPRTAAARTISNTRLLRLLRDDLLELLAKAKKSNQAFANMILERSRPKCVSNIIAHQQVSDDGEATVILKNQAQHEYYQLTQEGWLIWQYMNGKRTVKEITMALVRDHNIFSPSMVVNLMLDLAQYDFIEIQGYRLTHDEKLPTWMKYIDNIKKIMEVEWPFPNINQWITKVYENRIKIFFTIKIQIIMLLIVMLGTISFVLFSHHAIHLIPRASHIILVLILIDIAGLISIPLHELAHAFTTKHFGREVTHFGIGWYWIGPMAYTDTSDMWLSTKWPRIMVNIAGVYCDLVLAGITSIIAYIVPWPSVAIFFWLFTIFIYLSIYHNLYPLIELDGYYILMDLFDRPHLREDAVEWLVEVLPKVFKQPVFTSAYKYEILYWMISILFIILSPVIAWYIQHFVLIFIFPGLGFGYWQLFLPVIAISLSLLSVWVEIQKQRRHLT